MSLGGYGMRITAVAALLLLAGAAHAQSDDEFSAGPYLGVAGSWGIEQFQNDGAGSYDDVGLDTRLGFRFLPYLAAEAEWEYHPGFDTPLGGLTTHALTANLKGFYVNENTGPFEPYALVGAGALITDRRGSGDYGFAMRFGGGMNMKFSDHVAFKVEGSYVQPTRDVDDREYVSVVWGLELSL
jgi:hypothetical protein